MYGLKAVPFREASCFADCQPSLRSKRTTLGPAPFLGKLLQHFRRRWSIMNHDAIAQYQRRVRLNRHGSKSGDAGIQHPQGVMPPRRRVKWMIEHCETNRFPVAL